jgi:magnesium-protoporphyrin O-methyltransferase
MDSLIYYDARDISEALTKLAARTRSSIVFTVAPKTPALMAMWYAGKLFPRSDRSPVMIPHAPVALKTATTKFGMPGELKAKRRVNSGFYISQAMELSL